MAERVLAGRYELGEMVGHGGMADVYKAHDKLLTRTVAVKILHEEYKKDAEFIGKFHREAQAAARLVHPNVVNIYDVGEDAGDHFIVMEYVPGSTLKERIKEVGSLPTKEALKIAAEIAGALTMAHKNNLVHCDVKPHNILLMSDGHAKIADFGIARAVTESTMTYGGNVIGSVHYFSPEQAKGTLITPKSDVYSLGIVLYEMLTGKLPFTGENPVSIAMKHLQEEAPAMRSITPDIPPIAEAVTMSAMNKDPERRPTAEEFCLDIKKALASLDRLAPSPSRQEYDVADIDPDATRMVPRVTEDGANVAVEDGSAFVSKKFIAGLALVLAIGFVVGAFIAFGNMGNKTEIDVPDVTGKQMMLARQLLEDGHLRVNVAETYDDTVPAGQVVSQDPEGGARVKEDRLVTIYVSKGGTDLDTPDLTGLSKADATTVLTKMGLKIGSVYEKYSREEAGTVIGQDPKKGMKITKGQEIDLTVSKGERETKVAVPDLSGAALNEAERLLNSRGLTSGNVSRKPSRQAEGTVLSQVPAAGSEVNEGTAIDLVIAEPEPEKPVTAPKVTVLSNEEEDRDKVDDNVPSPGSEAAKSK